MLRNKLWCLQLVLQVIINRCLGLNIPNLPPAQPYANINASSLVHDCIDISPHNRSPPSYPPARNAEAEIEFAIDRFIEIEDVAETISVTAALYIKWQVNTCTKNGTMPANNDEERIMVMDPDEVWHPAISFRNAVDDISMRSDYFSNRMEILYTPNSDDLMQPNRTLSFYWKRRGIFKAVCNLDLSKFPFDTQECPFQFYLVEAVNLIKFSAIKFTSSIPSDSVDGWRYVTHRENFTETRPDGDDLVSEAEFYVTFKRRPEYFINNLLAPCIVLAGLELVAFLIPPTESDRVCFSVYLLLAFAVGQAQVLNAIPKTPQFVLLNYFIQLLALVCGLCTIYAIIMFWFVSYAPERANRRFGRIRFVSFVEICCFCFFVLLFAGVTVFCLSQASIF